MAAQTTRLTGLPLDEYTKGTPPGWKEHLPKYPYRLYLEKLKLWNRITDVEEGGKGATIVGRLKGNAYTTAMKTKVTRQVPDGLGGLEIQNLTGDDAISAPAIEAIVAADGAIIQAAQHSGVRTNFALHENDEATISLDGFFEFARGRRTLGDYIHERDNRYDEAETRAGLLVNNVAQSHLLLKKPGLPDKLRDDLILKVDGNMDRYTEPKALLSRIAKKQQTDGADYSQIQYEEGFEGWALPSGGWTWMYDGQPIIVDQNLDSGSWHTSPGGCAAINDDHEGGWFQEEIDGEWNDIDPNVEPELTPALYGMKGKGKRKGKGYRLGSRRFRYFNPSKDKGEGKCKKGKGEGKKGKGYWAEDGYYWEYDPTYDSWTMYNQPPNYDDGWHQQSQSWNQHPSAQQPQSDGWSDGYGWNNYHNQAPWMQPDAQSAWNNDGWDGGYKGKYKGKGKGKGGDCTNCGSKWHNTADCPIPPSGKGSGAGFSYGQWQQPNWDYPYSNAMQVQPYSVQLMGSSTGWLDTSRNKSPDSIKTEGSWTLADMSPPTAASSMTTPKELSPTATPYVPEAKDRMHVLQPPQGSRVPERDMLESMFPTKTVYMPDCETEEERARPLCNTCHSRMREYFSGPTSSSSAEVIPLSITIKTRMFKCDICDGGPSATDGVVALNGIQGAEVETPFGKMVMHKNVHGDKKAGHSIGEIQSGFLSKLQNHFSKNSEIAQTDVKSAFLQAKVDSSDYMVKPPGEDGSTDSDSSSDSDDENLDDSGPPGLTQTAPITTRTRTLGDIEDMPLSGSLLNTGHRWVSTSKLDAPHSVKTRKIHDDIPDIYGDDGETNLVGMHSSMATATQVPLPPISFGPPGMFPSTDTPHLSTNMQQAHKKTEDELLNSFLAGVVSGKHKQNVTEQKAHTFFEGAFHMVRGRKMYGLIVDPGAAHGLIGVDTLKEFLDHTGTKPSFSKTNRTFVRIEGDPCEGLQKATIDLGLAGINA